MLWLGVAALASELVVEVVDLATGAVVLGESLPLPSDRTVPAGRRRGLGLYVARFDHDRAVLELVGGKVRDGHVRARVPTSFELDPGVPFQTTFEHRRHRWMVRATLDPRTSDAIP